MGRVEGLASFTEQSGGAERTATSGVSGALVDDASRRVATSQLVTRRRYLQLLVVMLPDVVERLLVLLHVPPDAPQPCRRRRRRRAAPAPVTPTPPTCVVHGSAALKQPGVVVLASAHPVASAAQRQVGVVVRQWQVLAGSSDDPSVII